MQYLNPLVTQQYLLESERMDRETSHFSFVKRDHPSYQEILTMGRPAIILMLQEIRDDPSCHIWWRFEAICEIAKAEGIELMIIPRQNWGIAEQTRQYYIAWGKQHNLI